MFINKNVAKDKRVIAKYRAQAEDCEILLE